MQNFIVLGLVPGTNLQITFLGWTTGLLALTIFVSIWLIKRAHIIRNWILIIWFIWTTRHTRHQLPV